jgi:lipopolysaccharide/colanic/teichoic acid biosynthesis glycosyltransferase
MISNLPLNLPDVKRKAGTRVVSLSASPLQRYTLCIGSGDFFDKLHERSEEYVYTVKDVKLSKNVLRDQLYNGVVPSFIVCHFDHCSADLKAFKKYLRSNVLLAQVPVFVYTEQVTAEIRETIRRIGGIDDILTPDVTPESFKVKFETARQFREMALLARLRAKRNYRPGYHVNYIVKRAIDITVAGTALLLLLPLFITVAILIRLESKGPIFYISRRAGNRYRIFKFYKFRTMVPDADKQVAQMMQHNQYDTNGAGPVFFKLSNDPRVTRLGSFLRNTSLDELPQLLNVVLGDMSLVGNRPLPLYEAATLTTDHYAGRFLAPAGITGLWQIKKRGKKDMSVSERINLDISYAEKHSVLYDMWILANTPNALRQKDNV